MTGSHAQQRLLTHPFRHWRLIGVSVAAATTLVACTGQSAPHIATARTGGESPVSSAASTPALSAQQIYVQSKRAYAACARSEGIKLADPDSEGNIKNDPDVIRLVHHKPSQPLAPASEIAALQPCLKLIKYPPIVYTPLTDAELHAQQKIANCMRSHGVTGYPDPVRDTDPKSPDVERYRRLLSKVAPTAAFQKNLKPCSERGYGLPNSKPKG